MEEVFCPGGNPPNIGNTTSASGGNGNYIYSWQFSTDNISWTYISSTNAASYDPPSAISQTTYYRRTVLDGCNSEASTTSTQFTIYPEPVSQTINPGPAITYSYSGTSPIIGTGAVCAGTGVSATFSGGQPGVPGDYTDVYQYSIDKGATWNSYTPGTIISTTNLSGTDAVIIETRRIHNYRPLGCNYGAWNQVRWTVNPIPTLSSSLAAARTSSSTFIYDPQSSVTGTSFAWSRDAVAGISNSASSGTGGISESLVNTTHNPIDVTYHYVLNANGCSNTQDIVLSIAGASATQFNVYKFREFM